MSDGRQMNTDLMGASRIDLQFQKSELAVSAMEPTLDEVVRNGFAPDFLTSGHPGPSHAISADFALNRSALPLNGAVDERDVRLAGLPAGELGSQLPMRMVVLGDNHQAAGRFVQAMHDARAEFSALLRESFETVEQSVHQSSLVPCVVGRAGSCMNHHACRLVDDSEIFVFIDNVEGYVFGDGAQRRGLQGTRDIDAFVSTKFIRGFRELTVYRDFALGDQMLHTGTAHVRQLRHQELVKALARFFAGDQDCG
jgi:hypothetical protein